MSPTKPLAPIFTHVAHATWGENYFRGYKVNKSLVGEEDGFWSAISLAIGGVRFTAEQARKMDDVAICMLAGDPRIWPLKTSRLIGSYGSMSAAFAATSYVAGHSEVAGGDPVKRSAEFLVTLSKSMPTKKIQLPALENKITELIEQRKFFYGFGVPQRDIDERVESIKEVFKKRNYPEEYYWTLLMETAAILRREKKLEMNVVSLLAAIFLDLSFNPVQIRALLKISLLPTILANACEESQQKNPQLQKIPLSHVDYQGPSLRLSPRAERAL